MAKVGIPRALLYYQYYPMWTTFFEKLGVEVVVSAPTTKTNVAAGAARVVAETCLPVKVYCGHVISLADKCDFVFIPSIRALEKKVYNCSKFLGLPDVVKAVVPECPPILDPDIDLNQGKRGLYQAVYGLARRFTWNPLKVKDAAEAAWQAHLDYQTFMQRRGTMPPEALEEITGIPRYDRASGIKEVTDFPEPNITIALIGHPYVLYDDYINHKIVTRLRTLRVRIVSAEMVSREELNAGVMKLVGRPYWTYEDEVVGAGGHYLDADVDGVISIYAFGCGPDSVMVDVVKRYSRHPDSRPFMALSIDEHTAEAGLLTRLEAFIDMLRRRKAQRAKSEPAATNSPRVLS